MIKLMMLIRKFGPLALPHLVNAIEALLSGDFGRYEREGLEAARIAALKKGAREYLKK